MKEKISKSFNSNSTKCSNNNNNNKSSYKLTLNSLLFMNFKEKNFFPSNKINNQIPSLKQIEKKINLKFKNFYSLDNNFYNIKIINEIIFNESTHIVSLFKEILINDDNSEFFQNFYTLENSKKILPKIYEYYIACSVIFPNYVILPESKYIYKNIQRKQRVIDNQQELEEKIEREKKNFYNNNKYFDEQPDDTVFTTEAFDSILNQTNTSESKRMFGIKDSYYKGNNSSIEKIIQIIDDEENKKNKKKIVNMNLKKNLKRKKNNNNKNNVNNNNLNNNNKNINSVKKNKNNNCNEMYFKRNLNSNDNINLNNNNNNKGRNYKRNINNYKSNSLLNFNNISNINNSKNKNIYSTIDVELKNNFFSNNINNNNNNNNNYNFVKNLFLNNNKNKSNINKKIIFSILSNNKNVFLKNFFKKKVKKNSEKNIINSYTKRNLINHNNNRNKNKNLSLSNISKDFKTIQSNLNAKNGIIKIPLTTRENEINNNNNNNNNEIINLISKKIDKKKNKIQFINKSISPHKSKNLILNTKTFLPKHNMNPSGSIKQIKGINIKGFDDLIKNNKNYSRNLLGGLTNSERYFNSYISNSSRSLKKNNTKKILY